MYGLGVAVRVMTIFLMLKQYDLVPTVIHKQGKNMKRIADSCGAKLPIGGKGMCHGHLLSNIT